MNPMKDSLEIMDSIMGEVVQTKVWESIQLTNPAILAADKHLSDELTKLPDSIPKQTIGAIEDATIGLTNAFVDAAILYGIRIAFAVYDVTNNPNALSQYIMDRIAKRGGGDNPCGRSLAPSQPQSSV